jgi:hypothetical protein
MGFADSMSGIGRALGGLAETAINTLGPALVQAGTQFVVNKAFPGQTANLPPQRRQQIFLPDRNQQVFFPAPPRPNVFSLPPGPVAQTPFNVLPGVQPARPMTQFPQVGRRSGGRRQGVFPASTGGSAVSQFPGDERGFFDIPGFDLRSPFVSETAPCPVLFRPGAASARPVSMFMVPNPMSGKPTFYRHVGQPILFAGDLTTCKKVEKVARRARRARGRR